MQLIELRHPTTGKTWKGPQVDANELMKRGWVGIGVSQAAVSPPKAEAPKKESVAFISEAHVEDAAVVRIEPPAVEEVKPAPKEEKKKRKYIRGNWR